MNARLMTVHEVGDLLRMSPKTVRAKTRRGEIPGFKTGPGSTSPYRYDRTQIELLIARWKRTSA